MMKKFSVEISQNGWEYTGYAYIKCNEIVKLSDQMILADNVEIQFDEEIGKIKEISFDSSLEF